MVTRRDFLKLVGAAGVGMVAGGALIWKTMSDKKQSTNLVQKPSPHTWVRFIASANETMEPSTINQNDRLNHYRVREVVPVRGEAPDIAQGWSVTRIETSMPISISDESLSTHQIQFYGVTQNLHYTSDAQRQELEKLSRSALEPSDQTTAVLIPIGKSDEWWKLAQDQRQAYFQKTDRSEGHTAIGIKYADRIFRKLYHSRYLNAVFSYDFLTYFEFENVYEKDFKTLLAQLRDIKSNPEWAFVDYEFEIWMTKNG